MALIAVVTYDTLSNQRSAMTAQTLASLQRTVDWSRHRLIVSDNGSIPETHALFKQYENIIEKVIFNGENLGTARAINLAWRGRQPGEHAVKMDNDCVVHQPCWTDWMEDVFQRDPTIGICGLKRNDLAECPWSENDWYRSAIRMLPHETGQRWIIVEDVLHVIGTCQAYSAAFLDKMGYLVQPELYGFDDSLAGVRAIASGYKSVFLHGFEIAHIDPGATPYTEWKKAHAGQSMEEFHRLKREYLSGERPVYYDGDFK